MSTTGGPGNPVGSSQIQEVPRKRRSQPFSLPRGKCQYPDCTEANITARHYGKVHGFRKEKFVTHRSGTEYMRCKITNCVNSLISGNSIHDAIKHILAEHPGTIPDGSEPVTIPADWQINFEQIADVGIRLADSTQASIRHLQEYATHHSTELASQITFLTAQLGARDARIIDLVGRNTDLDSKLAAAHSAIVQMRAKAHLLDEVDRIYTEYIGRKDT